MLEEFVPKILVFDFDGTLADTLEAVRRIFNDLAPDYGLKKVRTDDVPELRHLSLRALLKKLGVRKRTLPSILKRGKRLLRDQLDELRPCPGIFERLEELCHGVETTGILTSNSVENVEIFLRKHGERHRFDFISSCRKLKGKAKYLKAISRTWSVEPREMLYIGDEVRDVKACRKATVPVVAVSWGFNSRDALLASGPNKVVDDCRELCDLLRDGLSDL